MQKNKKPLAAPSAADFPMRINKYLAMNNYATRRGADELISKKQVLINGRAAVLGDKVSKDDKVEVRFRSVKSKELVYIAYNKPRGQATYYAGLEQEWPTELKEYFAVGGLDKDSHGLIILTNDGRLTSKLLADNPKIQREYLVKTKNPLRTSFKKKMEAGVKIEDGLTQKCKVKILGERAFVVILTEEKKHQVRRMCSALFQEVEDVERFRILNVNISGLKPGSYRRIEGKELENFLRDLL